MSNDNCLEGMACPVCGATESFEIEVKVLAVVRDDGWTEFEGSDWDDESFCLCRECGLAGKVADFRRAEEAA